MSLDTGGIPLETIGSTSKNVYGVRSGRKPHSASAPLSRFLGGASKKSKWEIGGESPTTLRNSASSSRRQGEGELRSPDQTSALHMLLGVAQMI